MTSPIEDNKLKELLKDAVIDALSERRDLFYDVMAEVLEDFALAKAIEEGRTSPTVAKEDVIKAL